jgi:hypothetical protein
MEWYDWIKYFFYLPAVWGKLNLTETEHEKIKAGKKGGLIRIITEGYAIPTFWGAVWQYGLKAYMTIAPIPLNVIFYLFLRLRQWIKNPLFRR